MIWGGDYNLKDDPSEYALWAKRSDVVERVTKYLDRDRSSGYTRY